MTDISTTYALFDFDDLSVEVGEVSWILNERLQASKCLIMTMYCWKSLELVRKLGKVKVASPVRHAAGDDPATRTVMCMYSAWLWCMLAISGTYIT